MATLLLLQRLHGVVLKRKFLLKSCFSRATQLSSSSSSADADYYSFTGKQNRQDGAWTLLAALDKAKEADNVAVAHLVSSLGYLWPHNNNNNNQPFSLDTSSHQQHKLRPSHSSDPAFFSLNHQKQQLSLLSADAANNNNNIEWTKQDVLDTLQASIRGRRIDIPTIEALLQAATHHFRKNVPSVVTLPKLESEQQLTVVGDLHGSLTDLNTVLGLIGDPSANNRVIFNGDLADRGDHGIEVIAVVCALVLAFPNYVHLNRGNHEDLALSVAYGLATELQHKYGTAAFRHFSGLLDDFFRSLPLLTVVEEDALIVHGGPPPPGWTIASVKEHLEKSSGFPLLSSRTSRTNKGDDTDVIMESCLWSDPDVDEEDGTLINYINDEDHMKPNLSRGAGFKFDATIIKTLLEREGLKRFIRSHEPVRKGCARYTVCDKCDDLELFTVFSASRYPYKQGFNDGAILRLLADGKHTVQRYATEDDDAIIYTSSSIESSKDNTIQEESEQQIVDSATIREALKTVIQTRRAALERAYNDAAAAGGGGDDNEEIPFQQSMEILIQGLNLQGEGLSQPGPMLALAKALTEDDILPETLDILGVLDAWYDNNDEAENVVQPNMMASGWLEAIFAVVDTNHDDEIDKAEWLTAVEYINTNLPKGSQEIDAEFTWKLLDRDNDGRISASEWSTLTRVTCR